VGTVLAGGILTGILTGAAAMQNVPSAGTFDDISPIDETVIAKVQASSADMSWKAIQRNSLDYIELKKAGVNFFKTPDAILRNQLEAWDKVIAKKSAENPLFKKVLESQRAFAQRAGAWQNDYLVDFKLAWNHYFGRK
jgi:TRAP-type mannitol/chloroaromatic compound transport system substrate-binding protein